MTEPQDHGHEHDEPAGTDPDHAPDDLDLVGDDEAPPGTEQLNPLKGLMDPERNPDHSPAGDAEAPARRADQNVAILSSR